MKKVNEELIPPTDGFSDYIHLFIDESGKITNWKKSPIFQNSDGLNNPSVHLLKKKMIMTSVLQQPYGIVTQKKFFSSMFVRKKRNRSSSISVVAGLRYYKSSLVRLKEINGNAHVIVEHISIQALYD